MPSSIAQVQAERGMSCVLSEEEMAMSRGELVRREKFPGGNKSRGNVPQPPSGTHINTLILFTAVKLRMHNRDSEL